VERCEVELYDPDQAPGYRTRGMLVCYRDKGGGARDIQGLHESVSDPDFLGYEYADGTVSCSPARMVFDPASVPDGPVFLAEKPVHPTHVLFRRKA